MKRINEILKEAQECLDTASVGLAIAKLGPSEIKAGFRNVAIFGKMVTFCTNNLRGKVEGFEEWDRAAKDRFFGDDLARTMSDARNQFEKRATNPISSVTHIRSFSTSDIARFPRPPHATSFFIGDRFGGSGWMVRMENGDELPFYVDLPKEIGESKAVIRNGDQNLDLVEAAEQYLRNLEGYLEELRAFVSSTQPS